MQGTEVRNLHGLAEGKWPTLDQFRFGVGGAKSQRVRWISYLLTRSWCSSGHQRL